MAIEKLEEIKGNPVFSHVNRTRTFHAVYRTFGKNPDHEDLDFDIYLVEEVKSKKTEDEWLDFNVMVRFPSWVACHKGENRHKKYVN